MLLRTLPPRTGGVELDMEALFAYLKRSHNSMEPDLRLLPDGSTGVRVSGLADLQSDLGVPWDLGQCRLTKSGADLRLSPHNGNRLWINRRFEVVPDVDVVLTTAGLAADTTYYIYAFMDRPNGVMALVASTTVPVVLAGTGVRVQTGDSTRTLVGMARTVAGPAWADTDAQRFVLSYFNRRGLPARAHFTADRSTASTSTVELHTEIRVECLTWADEVLRASYAGSKINTGANATWTTIGLDGGNTIEGSGSAQVATSWDAMAASVPFTAPEGFHFVTLLGRVTAGTGTWAGSGTIGEHTSLTVEVRG